MSNSSRTAAASGAGVLLGAAETLSADIRLRWILDARAFHSRLGILSPATAPALRPLFEAPLFSKGLLEGLASQASTGRAPSAAGKWDKTAAMSNRCNTVSAGGDSRAWEVAGASRRIAMAVMDGHW